MINKTREGVLTLMEFTRFAKFLIAGVVGLGINTGFLFVFTDWIGLFYLISAIIAGAINVTINYFWNNYWAFSDRENSNHALGLGKFYLATGIETGIYFGLLILFTEVFGIYYLLSSIIAIAIRLPVKYFLCLRWVFSQG